MNEQVLKRHINKHNLLHRNDVIKFIENNPENLSYEELSRIAELINNSRENTAAYYTDSIILQILSKFLPEINKDVIKILEPSVGVGNFLQVVINKYKNAEKVIIDVIDIDSKSIELTKILNKYRDIPSNVIINYHKTNFLSPYFKGSYDLIIGNPPFLRLSNKTGLNDYSKLFDDKTTKNISGFFLQKAITMGKHIILILPKYFLSNPDFSITRDRVNKFSIEKIVDFGENGFKGVLIETIALQLNTLKEPNNTMIYSVPNDIYNQQPQQKMTSKEFPYWLIYRDDFFDEIAKKMEFSIFDVFRDRQLTNKILKKKGDIPVIKSRNINRDGTGISTIKDYDSFIDKKELSKYSVSKYLNNDQVFLCPNMTYYPRVIRKPKGVIVNGSVAILKNISKFEITDDHLKFLCSPLFEKFYKIARNFSTRSLNIDKNSVYFFGLYNLR